MEDNSLKHLILAHLDGRLSDEEFAEIQLQLEADSDARALYAELAWLDAELRETGAVADHMVEDASSAMQEVGPQRVNWTRLPIYAQLLAVAAVFIVMLIPTWMLYQRGGELDNGKVAVTTKLTSGVPIRSIAVISAEADAVWGNEGEGRFGKGTTLEPGKIFLIEGLAQIDFFSGASITLSGPAEIDLRSSNLAILHSGRVRADVPPAARGFEILAADVRLEDLGTSFGISADADGEAEIVVFDGEVRVIDSSGDTVSLFAGDAAHLAGGKSSKTSANDIEAFVDIAAVVEKSGGLDESRYASWKAATTERRKDSRLIAYYDFEDLTDASRRLPNRAVNGEGSELDGGIVGARVTRGRWPAKTALDFRGEGDRVRFNIPGEFDAITLYAWVRIDALDRKLNSLFLTDHYDPGEIHWQLSVRGSLHFSTSPVGVPPALPGLSQATTEQIQAENRWYWSDEFWDVSQSGKWFLLATTIDRSKQERVAHYINGQRVGFSDGRNMEKQLPKMRIGTADLGNWTDPILQNAIRSLNGRIDEFAIYSAALTAEEILVIYEQGKP
ncbi:MAG: hypothetical protein COA78_36290 [Blastopirellula sp.]|nr:MAG: hypothetical protein COA78_36290 [Blastopirellula sp.]